MEVFHLNQDNLSKGERAPFLGRATLYPPFAIETLSGTGYFLPRPICRKGHSPLPSRVSPRNRLSFQKLKFAEGSLNDPRRWDSFILKYRGELNCSLVVARYPTR